MGFLNLEYASWSLAVHLGLFVTLYGSVFTIFNVLRPKTLQELKLTQGRYPSEQLVWKEVRRSTISVLIAWAMDLGVMAALDHSSFIRQQLMVQDPTENRWFPQDGSVLNRQTAMLVGIVLLWADAHFFWIHRLLHEVPILYKKVHKIHHESYNPDVFSGMSFHPVEGFLYFTSMLSFLLFREPIWVYHIHRLMLIVAPVHGHNAHAPVEAMKYVPGEKRRWFLFDPVDHWIHHTKFNYNYGSGLFPISPWDNLCGTAWTERPLNEDDPRANAAADQAKQVQQSMDEN